VKCYVNGVATVTDQPSEICAPNPCPGGQARVYNSGPSVVYLGGTAVTTTSGFPLAESTSLDVPVASDTVNMLYGVCASGESATVVYLYPQAV
jgi:hypothetical protein